MPANIPDFTKGAPFDPGYAPHLISFLPAVLSAKSELGRIKNFGQKKLRFRVLNKITHKALLSTLGFWIGCILWGGFIKYKFQEPKEITGNDFLGVKKEDIQDFEYSIEFDEMENYLDNYSKDMKYYVGIAEELPVVYKVIVEEYRQFIELNDNFLGTKTTQDIKIPPKFEFLAQYSEQELDELYAQIMSVIDSKDLSGFLEMNSPVFS